MSGHRNSIQDFFEHSSLYQSIITSEAFKDTSEVKRYFTAHKKNDEYLDKYEAINALVDCLSDIWSIGITKEQKCEYIHIENQSKAVPVSYRDLTEYLLQREQSSEPPLRLITRIAVNDYQIINQVIESMHKVLRRKRDFVAVDRVQQIDTQCIRWLTRQPGRNTYERAGNRQKILSVVRYESFDTLENRVLKQFLVYARINCDSYLHEYHDKYPNSSRIAAVRRLKGLIASALENCEFQHISNLYSIPQPNYVLQNNPSYKRIWELYLQLIRKTRLIETIWANRDRMISDIMKMLYLVMNHHYHTIEEGPIRHDIWIDQFADEDGNYFNDTSWNYMDFDDKNQKSSFAECKRNSLTFHTRTNKNIFRNEIFFAYVPTTDTNEIYAPQDGRIYMAITENNLVTSSRNLRIVPMTGKFIDNLMETLKELITGAAV